MNLSNEQLQKIHPFYQILVAVLMSLIGIISSKVGLFNAQNDWNVVCYGLLCFIVANPVFGFMQRDTVKYIGTSYGCIFAFLLMFLFAGKFGLISRFSEAHDNQIIIIAFLVFYTVLTVISVLMKAFYRFTQ